MYPSLTSALDVRLFGAIACSSVAVPIPNIGPTGPWIEVLNAASIIGTWNMSLNAQMSYTYTQHAFMHEHITTCNLRLSVCLNGDTICCDEKLLNV